MSFCFHEFFFYFVALHHRIHFHILGAIVDPGTIGLGIDKQGWMLHAAVHEARPDVRCIIHLNTPATVAVSDRFYANDSFVRVRKPVPVSCGISQNRMLPFRFHAQKLVYFRSVKKP